MTAARDAVTIAREVLALTRRTNRLQVLRAEIKGMNRYEELLLPIDRCLEGDQWELHELREELGAVLGIDPWKTDFVALAREVEQLRRAAS